MAFYYEKLIGRIIVVYGSKRAFCQAYGMSEQCLSNKLSGKSFFSTKEVVEISTLLNIKPDEVCSYFFDVKVY